MLSSGHIKVMIVFKGVFGSGWIGLSKWGLTHSGYLLSCYASFILPSGNCSENQLCPFSATWFRMGLDCLKPVTMSSVAHIDSLELLLGSFIVTENLWNRLILFFLVVCMRVWVLDLDVVRGKGWSFKSDHR